jgi:hypothetical protein
LLFVICLKREVFCLLFVCFLFDTGLIGLKCQFFNKREAPYVRWLTYRLAKNCAKRLRAGTNNRPARCQKSPVERGILLWGPQMSEVTDFFQKEAQECRRLAAAAIGKNDREYWLQLADRWEWLVQPSGATKEEADRGLRFDRPISKRFAKRVAKRRAA